MAAVASEPGPGWLAGLVGRVAGGVGAVEVLVLARFWRPGGTACFGALAAHPDVRSTTATRTDDRRRSTGRNVAMKFEGAPEGPPRKVAGCLLVCRLRRRDGAGARGARGRCPGRVAEQQDGIVLAGGRGVRVGGAGGVVTRGAADDALVVGADVAGKGPGVGRASVGHDVAGRSRGAAGGGHSALDGGAVGADLNAAVAGGVRVAGVHAGAAAARVGAGDAGRQCQAAHHDRPDQGRGQDLPHYLLLLSGRDHGPSVPPLWRRRLVVMATNPDRSADAGRRFVKRL